MPAHRTRRWSTAELAVMRERYPQGGSQAVMPHLTDRSWHAVYVMANKMGLHCPPALSNAHAPRPKLRGADLEEAIRLREQEHWSFARIGERFGIAETSATNAVMIALCTRQGFTPAQRDRRGCLTDEGRARLRYALKKGLKGIDIMLRLGVSAACVAEQRRRYNAELKAGGKALLPPPGGGERYSGVAVSRAKHAEAEQLFLQGLGTSKVHERTGVSKTSCTRIRTRLIRRLRRKGECLPGCDAQGFRRVQFEGSRFVTEEQKQLLRAMLLDGQPVSRAARQLAVGAISAYQIRDALAAELAARGETLPVAEWRKGHRQPKSREAHWPPSGSREIYAFRELLRTLPFDEAKARWRADHRASQLAEEQRPKSFEEQLARVAAGEVRLVTVQPRAHLEPRGGTDRHAA
jgi:hypothetical protein